MQRHSKMRRAMRGTVLTVAMCVGMCVMSGSAFASVCSYNLITGAGPSPMTVTLSGAGESVIITADAVTGLLRVNGIPCTNNPVAWKISAAASNNNVATGVLINGGAGNDTVTLDMSSGAGIWSSTGFGLVNCPPPLPANLIYPIMGRNEECDGTNELELKTALGAGTNSVTIDGSTGADTLTVGSAGGSWTTDSENGTEKPFTSFDAGVIPDWVYTGLNSMTLQGGGGNDTISSAGVTGNTGNPIGGYADVTLDGGASNDTLTAGWGSTTLRGGSGNDTVNGGDGNDTLDEGSAANGADVLDGGAGTDTVTYGARTNAVVVSMGSGADDGEAGELDTVTATVEGLVTGAGVDTVTGSSNGDTISTGSGPDNVSGGSGNDTISAGDGSDTIDGGSGSDVVNGGNGDDRGIFTPTSGSGDVFNGDAGTGDTIVLNGTAGADTLTAGVDGYAIDTDGTLDASSFDTEKVEINGNGGADQISAQGGFGTGSELQRSAAIDGGPGDDAIQGGVSADTITGGSGNDTISGFGGDDVFTAGTAPDGADTINGGDGHDEIDYHSRTGAITATLAGGNDDGESGESDDLQDVEVVDSGLGDDFIVGTAANETFDGSGGIDVLNGAGGINTLYGGSGDDVFRQGISDAGDDTIVGGTGNDTVSYTQRASNLDITIGVTQGSGATTSGEHDTITTDVENVLGGGGNDTFHSVSGTHLYDGGAGDDTYLAGTVADQSTTFNGGVNYDTADYSQRPTSVTMTADDIADDGAPGEQDSIGFDVEHLIGTPQADVVQGGSYNDLIEAGGGDDSILGSAGNDTENGGPGNDTYNDGAASNGSDTIVDASGTDTVSYAARTTGATIRPDGSALSGAPGEGDVVPSTIEHMTGGGGDDTIKGTAGANTIIGGGGSDIITPLGGNDNVNGGLGNDTILSDAVIDGDDTYTGGGATGAGDTVSYASRGAGVTIDLLAGTAGATAGGESDGLSGIAHVVASDQNDTISGTNGNDVLEGRGGDDTITALQGNDVLAGGDGNDTLTGNEGDDSFPQGLAADGNDAINGGSGANVVDYSERSAVITATTNANPGNGDLGAGESDGFVAVTGIMGGSNSDTLTGDAGANMLDGGGGDDVLDGLGNADVITGGAGDDVIHQGAAPDGSDTVTGGDGIDTIDYTGRSADIIIDRTQAGGDGDAVTSENDSIAGDVENLDTGSGNDSFIMAASPDGADLVHAGAGTGDTVDYSLRTSDTTIDTTTGAADDGSSGEGDAVGTDVEHLVTGDGADTVTPGAAVTTIDTNGGNDTVTDSASAITVTTGDGNDTATDAAGIDTYDMGAGNDTIIADPLSANADVYDGGADTDTVSYALRSAAVTVTLDGVANDGAAGGTENDRVGGAGNTVENVIGTSAGDSITGNGAANTLTGGLGNDTLSGAGANDTLQGGTGNDAISGGTGIDTVSYADRSANLTVKLDGSGASGDLGIGEADTFPGNDVEALTTGSGNDTIIGSGGSDIIDAGPGNDSVTPGAGNDTVTGGPGTDRFIAGTTLDGDDTFTGGTGADTADYSARTAGVTLSLDGTTNDGSTGEHDQLGASGTASSVEQLIGGAGSDALIGGAGAETFVGNGGNDTFDGGTGADVFQGGAGSDLISYATRSAAVAVQLNGLAASGAAGEQDAIAPDIESAIGGAGNDLFIGSNIANGFTGGRGNDVIRGGGGNDVLRAGIGNDTVDGGTGSDIEFGDAGNDKITGGVGVDKLFGGAGADLFLARDKSKDVINGGAGKDSCKLKFRDKFDKLISVEKR